MFRNVHCLNGDEEEKIIKRKYPNRSNATSEGNYYSFPLINDIAEIKNIPEEDKNKYGIYIKNGICPYEGLQERQDAVIKMNMLWKTNAWCSINQRL